MDTNTMEDVNQDLVRELPADAEDWQLQAPIQEAVNLFYDGKLAEAGKLLFDHNPLSSVCSYVCPQEDQYKTHDLMGPGGVPVHISSIQRYISDYYLSTFEPVRSTRENGKVAVIGAGPAGMAMSIALARKNYDVTLFEQYEQIGGNLRYGIPEFRLPNLTIDVLATKLVQFGVRIRPNTVIGINLTMDDLLRDGYEAVYISTGTWRPGKLGIKGESLGHVYFAVEYLKSPTLHQLGKKVIVIGAGNVAMDAARTAFRYGATEVTIYCRTNEASITALDHEVYYAKIDGASFTMYKTAKEIVDDGVIFLDNDIKGRPIAGTEKHYDADSVIIAIGQRPRSIIVQSTTGIAIDERRRVTVDANGQTTREGVFSGGDVVTGARTVIDAVMTSLRVAESIDDYIKAKRAKTKE